MSGAFDQKMFALPYIGVCDVRSQEDILALRARFTPFEPLFLKAGVTMTRRVLWGIPSEWKKVCPPKRRIAKIFGARLDLVLNTVHYPDYAGVDLEPSLERVAELGGPHLNLIQLDMIWPDPAQLEHFRTKHPSIGFILQIGTKALAQVDDNPLKLWEAVKNYEGIVSRFLLDKSGGEGRPLDARSLVRFVDILYERMKEPGVGVAGGLGPETYRLVEPLHAMYPRLSIDAQGKLHEGGRTLLGPLSMDRADGYVVRSVELHRAYNTMS